MRINIAIIIVLSFMIAVIWCSKCNIIDPDAFTGGNFNTRNINADARRGPGTGKHNTLVLSSAGWGNFKPVYKEGFAGWSEIQAAHDTE